MPAPSPEMGNIDTSVTYFQRYHISRATRLLDIGTYLGSFVHALNGLGYEQTTGIDVDFEAMTAGARAHPGLRGCLLHYGGKSLPFADGSFEVVTMFDVLEHLDRPAAYLGEVYRILKPNGLLIFQTPNLITNIPWEIIQHRSFTYWRSYHRSLQTLVSLKKLLRQSGFTDATVEKHNLDSDYNAARARRTLGALGVTLMRLAQSFPLGLYPNFWGSCRKPPHNGGQGESGRA